MIEAFWIPLLPPFLIGLALSCAIEALLRPRPVAPWRRPIAALGVHLGVWTLAFALELALFRRPYFGAANVLAIQMVVVLTSNAKHRALREPFVYSDFEYFTDAIKHPRLYLPFFGLTRALAAAGGYGVALWAGLILEKPVEAGAASLGAFHAHALALAVAAWSLAYWAARYLQVSCAAVNDLFRLGLIAALWAYRRSERRPVGLIKERAPYARSTPGRPLSSPRDLPDLVTVQSESFFDARREFGFLRPDLLPNFDRLRAEAAMHGQLNVPAWGANTVRTEFAFLSGITPAALGVHRYNPYRKLAKDGFPTVASYLRSLGYRTVCIHPFHATFYRRDQVFPKLGFDEFVDISSFEPSERFGPYIGDQAVAERVCELLGGVRDDRPLYVHVITMENHGPLHLESINGMDIEAAGRGPMPEGCKDLVAYARHLANADAMFGMIRRALAGAQRPGGLCIFGDHMPIMPDVYEQLHTPSGATDYVIWMTEKGAGLERSLSADQLANCFLSAASLQDCW